MKKVTLFCLLSLILWLPGCSQPPAPITGEAVKKINGAINASELMRDVSDQEYGSAESLEHIGAYMKEAFAKAGYDSDKTFRLLVTMEDSPEKRKFVKASGLYRVFDSVRSSNTAEIAAWLESGVVSSESLDLYRQSGTARQ